MRIEAHFVPSEIDPARLAESTAVVIDVVRATTSIVEALANGAGSVYPTLSTEDAVRLAQSLGREDTVLCGERKGVKVEGFDLGNSPHEFDRETVEGKKLVMSTTNGTHALGAASEAARVLVCAFTNLAAVAAAVAEDESVVVVCAGREGAFSFDDALCAGHLIRRVRDAADEQPELDDAAWAACTLAEGLEPTEAFLRGTNAGRSIEEIGLVDDLALCVDVDRHDIVPVMLDQTITVSGA